MCEWLQVIRAAYSAVEAGLRDGFGCESMSSLIYAQIESEWHSDV